MKIAIAPEILNWACVRAGLDSYDLLKRFPKFQMWEQGTAQPTLKQLEAFAKIAHVPMGMLFLSSPPEEQLPIPDFRTMDAVGLHQPSPDLLETIYLCQQRQAWYRDYMQKQGFDVFPHRKSISVRSNVVTVASKIRKFIKFDLSERSRARTWDEALKLFKDQVENSGILVMASGVVGSNNRRTLDLQEFRGFALVDDFAPLIFINTNDTKSAQMFTLAHELVHIWLGESGVSDVQIGMIPDQATEYWCNQVASEILVPLKDLQQHYQEKESLVATLECLARRYKVSTLVILRRMYDLDVIDRDQLWSNYREELARLKKLGSRVSEAGGGDFYRTLGTRVSKKFVGALVASTLEGQTLFRDAFKMLGIKKISTFHQLTEKFGALA